MLICRGHIRLGTNCIKFFTHMSCGPFLRQLFSLPQLPAFLQKNYHKMKTAVAATLIASAAAFAPQSVSSIDSFADGAGVGVLSNGFA